MDFFGALIAIYIIYGIFKFIWSLFTNQPNQQPRSSTPHWDSTPQYGQDDSSSQERIEALRLVNLHNGLENATLRLAASIALADGIWERKEGLTIQKWMKKQVSTFKYKNNRTEAANIFNTEFKKAVSDAKKRIISIQTECQKFVNCSPGVKEENDLMNLCLDVMTADGDADEDENKQIQLIANLIGFSSAKLKKLIAKKTIKLKPTKINTSASSVDSVLGINPTWSKSKIKAHILQEFNKANALTGHDDPVVRAEANQTLQWLGEARKVYF